MLAGCPLLVVAVVVAVVVAGVWRLVVTVTSVMVMDMEGEGELACDECKVLSPTCKVAHEPGTLRAQQQPPVVELLPGDTEYVSQGIFLVKLNQVG